MFKYVNASVNIMLIDNVPQHYKSICTPKHMEKSFQFYASEVFVSAVVEKHLVITF